MSHPSQTTRKITAPAILAFGAYLFLNPLILFISAGTVKWGMAWIYIGISILATLLSRLVAHRKHPGLLEERASYQQAEDVKSWDKVLVPLAAIYGPLATIVIAGLDRRFNWSSLFPVWGSAIALLVGILGLWFASWAMVENRFFSAVVRIQQDRGHTICDSGPYRYIRHPGYAGGILWYLVTPVVLNAAWSFIPIMVSVVATVIRTALEDKTLQAELPGYREYARRTPFRLLPGIW